MASIFASLLPLQQGQPDDSGDDEATSDSEGNSEPAKPAVVEEADEENLLPLPELMATEFEVAVSGWLAKEGINAQRLLKYTISVRREKVIVLIDPGAQISLVDQSLVQRLRLERRALPQTGSKVKFAAGKTQDVTEWVPRLVYQVGGWKDKQPAVVVADLVTPMVFGMDWVVRHNPAIDWISGELRIGGCNHVWTLAPQAQTACSRIATAALIDDVAAPKPDQEQTYLIAVACVSDDVCIDQSPLPHDVSVLLDEFADVFVPISQLPPKQTFQHHIDTLPGAQPVRYPCFRLSEVHKQAITAQVSELLQQGLIRPSNSPWASRLLMVPKKDGTLRLCIDYHDLNQVTKRDGYPLPRTDNLLHDMAHARYFSKLDLQQGYHQLRLADDAVEKTAFSVPEPIRGSAHFEWLVVPFGLVNAPPFFQRVMDHCFQQLSQKIRIYMDDILIPTKTLHDHVNVLREVLQQLRTSGLRAKRSKCIFAARQVPFLGHLIGQGGLRVEPDKVEAIRKWQFPLCNVRQVRQFVGAASFYRAFIPHFADLAAPLTRMTKKHAVVMWTDEATKAVEAIIHALTHAPVLRSRTPERKDRVTTDASAIGIGGVFEQQDEATGDWHPCAFWSK